MNNTTQNWYEVYVIQDDQSTQTIFDCDTKEEAESFIFEHRIKYPLEQVGFDIWEMTDGIPNRVKPTINEGKC